MDAAHDQSQSPIPGALHVALNWLQQQPLAKSLYNHNPFYAISSALVFWGLLSSFDTTADGFNAWLLTLSLAGFTLLLVATAVLIIRWGKVWEDSRSILLLVVLMFLGISVTFDSILANSPDVAKWYYLGGLLFAIAVSETALHCMPLRLPALYRIPFYLLVALFFLYPLLMTGRLNTPHNTVLQWQLFAFSGVAAVVFLTLLPAIRRGPAYVQDNFSPWRWPLFPWVLFGMLWFCVGLRTYYLCHSLHFVGYDNSIFAPYFLAPLLLAAAVLFLEASLATGSSVARKVGLALPVVMVVLGALGHRSDMVYRDFLSLFRDSLHGTPLFASLALASAFYAVAAVRKVRDARLMLSLSILTFTLIGPQTLELRDVQIAQAWPMAAVGGVMLFRGLRRWQSDQVAIGACLLLAASMVEWPKTLLAVHPAIVPLHLLLAIFLIVGTMFRDDLAYRMRRWSAALMALLALVTTFAPVGLLADLPRWLVVVHPIAMVALAIGCGFGFDLFRFYAVAGIIAAAWASNLGSRSYVEAREHIAGLDQIAIGSLFFICATAISLAKAGILRRWWTRLRPNRESRPSP